MTAIRGLSFPGQRTTTATSCIPHDSVYMPRPRAGKSENGFLTPNIPKWLQNLWSRSHSDSTHQQNLQTLADLFKNWCHGSYSMCWQKHSILINEHALNCEPVPLKHPSSRHQLSLWHPTSLLSSLIRKFSQQSCMFHCTQISHSLNCLLFHTESKTLLTYVKNGRESYCFCLIFPHSVSQ